MSKQSKRFSLFFSVLFWIISLSCSAAFSTDSITLYTPYTKISVPPGGSIGYSIDVINNSKELQNLAISLSGMPKGWKYVLKAGTWNIGQLSILPGQKQTLSLTVELPFKINKGSYRFKIVAGEFSLPLTVVVSEQGTFETEFTAQQANMEGHGNSNFTFNAVLNNRTGEKQLYALKATAPRGWSVTFKANYIQATSVEIESNTTRDISIDINPPDYIETGTYMIPVSAVSGTASSSLNLEVVITGTYSMDLTTPTGLLSTSITAGDEKQIELVVNNTGSSILSGIEMASQSPANWTVSFDPKKVDRLDPGKNIQVIAKIKADKKAIAGDYVINIDAKTAEKTAKASIRISVKTPVILGWIGVLIIAGALGIVFYLFRKYGRR